VLEAGGSNPSHPTTNDPTPSAGFSWWLKTSRRLADVSIESKLKRIRRLDKQVNLWNVEDVQNYITLANWSNKYKELMEYAYKDWCTFQGFEYTVRHYQREERLPYIPSEREIDQLIAGMNPRYATLCQLLKETGMRVGEAVRLTPDDVDVERQIVTLNQPEKRSRPRQFKVSIKLVAMLMPLMNHSRLWTVQLKHIRKTFERARKRIAVKLGNPSIKRISFHTFRHWKATTEYHKTKDILHVMRLLGHKSIQNTLVYTHLVDFKSDEWTCKVAGDLNEAVQLIEAGFEYITEVEGKKLFRKRK
jgi:integrase